MSRLDRLRRLTREELAWRTRVSARIQRDRLAWKLRAPRWDRRSLAAVLAPHLVDPSLSAHLSTQNWIAAGRTLAGLMTDRPSLFVLDGRRATSLRDAILSRWPDAAADAASRADALLAGRFALLGYPDLDFGRDGRRIDWWYDPVHRRRAPNGFWAVVPYLDPASGDHKVIWELNRHQHWLPLGRALWLTGDRRYGRAIIEQLEDWLTENPPRTGINWASMLELGFRALSWTWALHFLLADLRAGAGPDDDQAWLVDLLIGLDAQLTHVERNLSFYFSPNTHLTGEALALYTVGRTVPELGASARWAATGRDVLLRELEAQIGRDGGHAERSMHYHRYTLDFYLLALLVAERSGDTAAAGPFREAVARLASFARGMADDHGRLAMIGDDDGGMLVPIAGRHPVDVRDSLALAAVALQDASLAPWGTPEETYWLWGGEPPVPAAVEAAPAPPSVVFPDTGYAVLRDRRGGHLILDTGSHGFLNGGHAHADALAVTLTVGGRQVLIDPGTGTYTMDPVVRDQFRHTASHNTVTLDGRPSSEPAGPFHWRTRTDARLLAWRANGRFAWVEGTHDGYAGGSHRRSVVHDADGGWLILDEILGHGRHAADLHWHFDPAWQVTCESTERLRLADGEGRVAWLLHDGGASSLVRGESDSDLGWCAPTYGQIVPTWTARFSHPVLPPADFVTWISGSLDGGQPPVMQRLPTEHDPGAAALGVRVRQGAHEELTVVRPGDASRREGRGCALADFHTDARLLHVRLRDREIVSVAIADGARALALAEGLVSLAMDRPVDALHVQFADEAIELTASAPPARLQMQGVAVSRARLLRVNGRELPIRRHGGLDTIVVTAAEWASPAAEARATCVA